MLHRNDDVNMSQSSNDTFPTALHLAAAEIMKTRVFPALERLIHTLQQKESEFSGILKCGRTHLQDAVPILFSQEISGWRASLQRDLSQLSDTLSGLGCLAIGGTAVGTGLNAPKGFDEMVSKELSDMTGLSFAPDANKFHALTSLNEIVFAHGAMLALAMDLMKIANDVRWLASGPRTGLGEITLPENEPGSSIMPGKVNPTQCEQVTMVCARRGSVNFQRMSFFRLPLIHSCKARDFWLKAWTVSGKGAWKVYRSGRIGCGRTWRRA